MLLAIKCMGGESTEAWRFVLDDLITRGLRRPEFLIVSRPRTTWQRASECTFGTTKAMIYD